MKKTALAIASLSAALALSGCKKEETPGEKLDHMTKNVQDAAKDAAKDLKK